jgi:hypothetical protein
VIVAVLPLLQQPPQQPLSVHSSAIAPVLYVRVVGEEHQVRIFVMIVIVSAGMTLFLADAGVVASQAVV